MERNWKADPPRSWPLGDLRAARTRREAEVLAPSPYRLRRAQRASCGPKALRSVGVMAHLVPILAIEPVQHSENGICKSADDLSSSSDIRSRRLARARCYHRSSSVGGRRPRADRAGERDSPRRAAYRPGSRGRCEALSASALVGPDEAGRSGEPPALSRGRSPPVFRFQQ